MSDENKEFDLGEPIEDDEDETQLLFIERQGDDKTLQATLQRLEVHARSLTGLDWSNLGIQVQWYRTMYNRLGVEQVFAMAKRGKIATLIATDWPNVETLSFAYYYMERYRQSQKGNGKEH